MRKSIVISTLLAVVLFLGSFGVMAQDGITIGLSMDNLRLERWQHDRDIFVERAEELGAEVLVQSANGDDMVQLSQAENLITQGIDVLVVVPHNGQVMGSIVREAHANDVPVLAYDRMLMDSEVDYYLSFDNVRVGELQAEFLVERQPEGKYFLLGGSPTDNNAKLFREGQMNVLQPYIDEGKIEVVGDQWAKDWLPQEALSIIENALTANNNDIDVIVASNDSTAGGAIEALAEQGLAGEVLVSGQDADLAAVQRVVEGTQTMTIYKPIQNLATSGAEIAVKMARGEEVETNGAINNGEYDVPSILLTPVQVHKGNMVDTVIEDGFHEMEEVYKNVPESEWPEQ
ncbi:xylose-binding protein [Halanaerobium saccharolyticum]|uniref:D-xylose-binding periplasmic protein n=1 Tax=Halanaerobium saccharolyticum TaxID=43595 RepID=A0A4R7Z0C2_9FIRM|nr:D-xylose ABC transporter substrate-binding protein [Halanaerobium saccharolyticum]RAK07189.1 xylose-binding protein [Halanaerobium saccharolyticum]TDW02102.1 xylose-binding protein [Halanaerobium saccharolyticum]TDX58833.1 xylose-binding protein [Halanaerobium saccharolyticum]